MRLVFLLATLSVSTTLANQKVSKPGDWVSLPKIGQDDGWEPPSLQRVDGDPEFHVEIDPLNDIDPNAQILPDQRNRHRENVPVLRNTNSNAGKSTTKGKSAENTVACSCGPASCPVAFMTEENVADCRSAHAFACWKENAACPMPALKKKK